MNKYIKAKTIIDFINDCLEHEDKITDIEKATLCAIKKLVERTPVADVEEVRHGRWHRYSKGQGSYNGVIILSDAFQCTICKESFWNKSDYCPHCGADMRESPKEKENG